MNVGCCISRQVVISDESQSTTVVLPFLVASVTRKATKLKNPRINETVREVADDNRRQWQYAQANKRTRRCADATSNGLSKITNRKPR